MDSIKLAVRGNKIALLSHIDLIAGTIGQKCKVFFDDSWNGLTKTIIYKVNGEVIENAHIEGAETVIPNRVLVNAGLPLEIAIDGQSEDKSILKPTTWCFIGEIKPSAHDYNIDYEDVDIIYSGGGVE